MKLSRATAVVMAVATASAVFGILREVIIAAQFGTTFDTDAYFFAFDVVGRLPEFLVPAIAGALIPVFMRSKREDDGDTSTFLLTVINLYAIATLAAGLLIEVIAPAVVAVLGSGFPIEQQPLAVSMVRLTAPSMTLIGVAGVLRSLLEAENKFFFAQISHVFLTLGITAAALFAAPSLGIEGMPLGILGGATVQVLWSAYWLKRGGLKYRFVIDIHDPRFKRFMRLLGPGVVGGILIWLIPVVDKWLASHLAEGAIASLSFGSRPSAILNRLGISSIAIAALPVFTDRALDDDAFLFRRSIERTVSIMTFTLLPASLLLATLRVPVIEILFQRGAFGAASVSRTASVFGAGVLALAPLGIGTIVSTAFKAVEDTKTPAFFGATTNLAVKVIAGPLLIGPFGVAGLAFSTTLMYTASGVLLLARLKRRVAGLRLAHLLRGLLRTLVASGVAALVVEMMTDAMDASPLAELTLGLGTGVAIFLVLSALMRAPEIGYFRDQINQVRSKRS